MLLAALIALLLLAWYGYNRLTGQGGNLPDAGLGQQEQERVAMIDVALTDMEGQTVQLFDLTGKPMVLHFWATWCGICEQEMPDWESLYQEFGDEVTFVMVDVVDGVMRRSRRERRIWKKTGIPFLPILTHRGRRPTSTV